VTITPGRRTFLKGTLAAGFAVTASGLLVACGDDDTSGDADEGGGGGDLQGLAVMMPFPIIMNFIADCAGVSNGFFEDEGLDVDLQFARTAPQAMQQLAGGGQQVVRTAPIAIASAVSNEGAPFVSIGMAVQDIVYVLVSSPENPYDSIESLEGATVGLPQLASSAEDTLDLVLRLADVDPESVSREAVGVESTAYALVEEGRVDAIFATKEAAAAMEAAGMAPNIAEIGEGNPLLGVSLASTRETIDSHHDTIVSYLRGLAAAMAAINDPDQLPDLIPAIRDDWDLPQLDDPESATPIIETIAGMWYSAGAENLLLNQPEVWEEGVANFARLGIVAEDAQPTDFYTNDLWDEAFG
jgi:ABC-type nitrate/sulfonate/bicarbonate transport system substrate-binding protein